MTQLDAACLRPLHYQWRFAVPIPVLVFLIRFLFAFTGLDPGLYEVENLFLMVQEQPTKSRFGGADETAIAFGWFTPALDVVPDTVGMRDKDKGVLFIESHKRLAGRDESFVEREDLHPCTTLRARLGYETQLHGRGSQPQRR